MFRIYLLLNLVLIGLLTSFAAHASNLKWTCPTNSTDTEHEFVIRINGERASQIYQEYWLRLPENYRRGLSANEKCITIEGKTFECTRMNNAGVVSFSCDILLNKDQPTNIVLPGFVGVGN